MQNITTHTNPSQKEITPADQKEESIGNYIKQYHLSRNQWSNAYVHGVLWWVDWVKCMPSNTLMIALLYYDQYVLRAVWLVSNWLHQSLESIAVARKWGLFWFQTIFDTYVIGSFYTSWWVLKSLPSMFCKGKFMPSAEWGILFVVLFNQVISCGPVWANGGLSYQNAAFYFIFLWKYYPVLWITNIWWNHVLLI